LSRGAEEEEAASAFSIFGKPVKLTTCWFSAPLDDDDDDDES
jgi:hypothetical protein